MFRTYRKACLLAIALLLMAPALARAQQSAVVAIDNKSGVSVRVGGAYYIDSSGAKQNLDAYWDIAAGSNTRLLLSGSEIVAQKFAFSIITPEGESDAWDFDPAKGVCQLNAETLQLHGKLALGSKTAVLGVAMDNAGNGAKIKSLVANGPAENAGIKVHDIIIEAGSRKVTDKESLQSAVKSHKPGDQMAVKVLRGNDTLEFKATLGNGGIFSKYPPLTAEDAKRLDRQVRANQIRNDIAFVRQDVQNQERQLSGFNFVAIPVAQVALAAAQKKLTNVQANPKSGFGDVIAAQLIVSAAEAVLNEAINSRNRIQTELSNNRSRLGQLESDLRAFKEN